MELYFKDLDEPADTIVSIMWFHQSGGPGKE
jgi:hypothetical protein